MTKNTTLLIFLFIASLFLENLQAQDLKCHVRYTSVKPPPRYERIIEAGEIVDVGVLVQDDPITMETNLDQENSRFTNSQFELNDIEFSGYCDCFIRAYTEANLKGCYVKEFALTNSYVHLFVKDFWKRPGNPQSFYVECFF